MSIPNSINTSYEFKKINYPFVYYFENKIINWHPKRDVEDIIKEIYDTKDMKIFKYNTKEGLFVRNIIEIQSKQEIILTDTTLKEQFRSNTKQDFITIEKPIIETHTLSFE